MEKIKIPTIQELQSNERDYYKETRSLNQRWEDKRFHGLKDKIFNMNEIIVTDKYGYCIYASEKFLKLYELEIEDIFNKKLSIIKSTFHNHKFYKKLWNSIINKNIWSSDIVNVTSTGNIIFHKVTIEPLLDKNEEIEYFVATYHNVIEYNKEFKQNIKKFFKTSFIEQFQDKEELFKVIQGEIKRKFLKEYRLKSALKRLLKESRNDVKKRDEIIKKQSRLAGMGEMLSIIAHQWRQPLASLSAIIIQLNMQLSAKKEKIEPEMRVLFREKFTLSQEILQNLSTTINEFKELIILDKVKEKFDVLIILENSLNALNNSFSTYNIDVEIKAEKNLPQIEGYPSELKECFVNLLNNSRQAITKKGLKGKIVIEISIEEELLSNKLIIKFLDNGGGIEDEIIPKIFEPYFSTKGKNGTGIGLYMVKMVIEHQGGNILFYNKINDSTWACFEISLPIKREKDV